MVGLTLVSEGFC